MPQVYTVATNNAFAAFDDNSDGEAILAQTEQTTQEQPAAGAAAQQQQQQQQQQQPKYGQRGGQQRGGPAGGNNRPQRPRSGNPPGVANDDGFAPRGFGGPARAGAAPKRTRAGRDMKENKEVRLDRHSGTGRGREMKREGAGPFNWGPTGDFTNQTEADTAVVDADAPGWGDGLGGTSTAAAAPAAGAAEGTAAAPVSDEPPKVTYADYLQQQEENRAFAPKEEAKKAAPQVEPGMKLYTKEVSETHRVGRAAEVNANSKSIAAPVNRQDVQLRYQGRPRRDDQDRDNNNRAGPANGNGGERKRQQQQQDGGASRSPQQRGGEQQRDRSQRNKHRDIDLTDKQAFPTLQAH